MDENDQRKHINSRLFDKLMKVENQLGGKEKSHNIEEKTRLFINKIISSLLFTFTATSDIKLTKDLEKQSQAFRKSFNQGIRPDFELHKKLANGAYKPVFVFEIKKQKQAKNPNYHTHLYEHLP